MASTLQTNLHNRNALIRELRRELMGPYPRGSAIPLTSPLSFADFQQYRKAHVACGSRQEIITGDPPRKRYGVGVLYPEVELDPAVPDAEPDEALAGSTGE